MVQQDVVQGWQINTADQQGLAAALVAALQGESGFGQMADFGQKGNHRLVGLTVDRRRGQAQFELIPLQPGQRIAGGPGLHQQA